ncbi:protein EOLA2 isoform X2 [Meles meles]|uniref:protein EOLA2 isoform X2 n=1 Tax=Meles meles TaxID=9662 RepID=UPI001E69EE4B|nr:protein EOLA2 isoform X2 [Meles meles]
MAREPRCGRSSLSSLRGRRRVPAGAWETVVLTLVASAGPSEAADPARWPQPGQPRVPAPPCPDPPASKGAGKPVLLRPARPSSGRPCAGEEAQASRTAFSAQTTKQLSPPSSASSPEIPSDGQVVLITSPFLWARQLTV